MKIDLRILALLGCLQIATPSIAMMTSVKGNKDLADNYKEWPGLLNVVNDKHRVLQVWVNGNENMYYKGDETAISLSIQKFVEAKLEKYQVVLLPITSKDPLFDGAKEQDSNWRLHVVGGIAAAMFKRNESKVDIFDEHPTIYVYIEPSTDMSKLKIPPNVELLGLQDMRARYVAGLKEESTTRGYAAMNLAGLDSDNPASVELILPLLRSEDKWFNAMAVSCLNTFGATAQFALPELEAFRSKEDHAEKRRLEVIEKIKAAKPPTEEWLRTKKQLLRKIDQFIAAHREQAKKR